MTSLGQQKNWALVLVFVNILEHVKAALLHCIGRPSHSSLACAWWGERNNSILTHTGRLVVAIQLHVIPQTDRNMHRGQTCLHPWFYISEEKYDISHSARYLVWTVDAMPTDSRSWPKYSPPTSWRILKPFGNEPQAQSIAWNSMFGDMFISTSLESSFNLTHD